MLSIEGLCEIGVVVPSKPRRQPGDMLGAERWHRGMDEHVGAVVVGQSFCCEHMQEEGVGDRRVRPCSCDQPKEVRHCARTHDCGPVRTHIRMRRVDSVDEGRGPEEGYNHAPPLR